MKLTNEEKEKCIKELLKSGAVRRENPSEYKDGSLGRKGLPVLEIKI
jgi:hypothetical protein